MDKNSIIEMIREKAEKIRNEEYRFPEFVECRDKTADCWELFCQKTEEADISEDDMRQLVFVLDFLSGKYYEALPKREFNTEDKEDMTIEEIKESFSEAHYMCESMRLMVAQRMLLLSRCMVVDSGSLREKFEALKEKLETISEEEIVQKIADAPEKDPWIFEIGAPVSIVRKFEELMGEHPEITEVLKENEGNNKFVMK